eukprot:TRINITY_DN24452_c0_g4_i1.p1 TRINITY_DN24452_c0_g4~~TRINITY_DN24452_c0_g4_i1.p1  ORF type:complete len:330 (-),score=65.03 TRINITY_DN24452_c0_g4_i1:99-1088(-)
MPAVFCGLQAFHALPETSRTCRAVAAEFLSRFDPSLANAGCSVEVYRLQRLAPTDRLSVDDQVLCNIPTWGFDMDSLEKLHEEVEDTKVQLSQLQLQHERAAAALATLSAAGAPAAALAAAVEASDAATKSLSVAAPFSCAAENIASGAAKMDMQSCAVPHRHGAFGHDGAMHEVQLLRQQLAEREAQLVEEKVTQQTLRADLLALKDQSQHLMQLVVSIDSGKPRQPPVPGKQANMITVALAETPGITDSASGRLRSPGGHSPQVVRSPLAPSQAYNKVVSVRPGTRPRSVQPRSIRHAGVDLVHHATGPTPLRNRRHAIGGMISSVA